MKANILISNIDDSSSFSVAVTIRHINTLRDTLLMLDDAHVIKIYHLHSLKEHRNTANVWVEWFPREVDNWCELVSSLSS